MATSNRPSVGPDEVLSFWFGELKPQNWFARSDTVDADIRSRFGATLEQASRGELSSWRNTAKGRLAEIIVLDQFSRNLHRGSAKAFSSDGMALVLAQEAIRAGAEAELSAKEKQFLYMPFEHSESAVIHEEAVKLFSQPGLEGILPWDLKHKEIIDRFGRYPHRNEVLGRVSTQEEIDFLKTPNSSF
eukprot:CAMPEP_0177648708 /NCGR_PEP_ID=MMETSP0447-20121125/10972_1 /TAXON_ID=0 /ORGANISM="Stygamoeba regulata, Strain BSH-02190019" /LENGTH=187 /DNA_ID=CAMNT_0019151367 /DNA_START=271 /DNA_END=834 /DNA_ORIENTATION=-